MSMICWLLGLTPAQIGALRAAPSLATDLARVTPARQHEERLAEMLKQMPPEKRAAAEARQAQFAQMPAFKEAQRQNAEALARLAGLGPIGPALSLEKSWHMLHYLLTGDVYGLPAPGNGLLSGNPVGEDVAGYGPARLIEPTETQDFAGFLAPLDVAQLEARVNYQGMLSAKVYGTPMGRGSEAEFEGELRREVARYFPKLRDYVAGVAERGGGVLIWLT